MSLRRQLLLVSLLLLSLPWAGCQFIREMEGALRQGQEKSLQATAQAIAAVVGPQQQLLYTDPSRRSAPAEERQSVYAYPTRQAVIIDGYDDGWEEIEGITLRSNANVPLTVTCRAQTRDDKLYLLLKVEDSEVVYHNPGLSPEPNGDRLLLRLWPGGRRQDYVIATAAPGKVRARPGNRQLPGLEAGGIQGYWQDAVGGYTLELVIPLSYTGERLGFYFINEGFRSSAAVDTVGNIAPLDTAAPPWLIYSPTRIQELLASFSQQGNHIQVVDKEKWLIADLPARGSSSNTDTETFWLLQVLYRSILSQDTLATPPATPRPGKMQGEEIGTALTGVAASHRYRDPDYVTRTLQSAAAPIRDEAGVTGAVVVRQSGETYLSLTDQAFSRLLSYSLLALGIGALGLLGYASLLSWRIRRLSRAASNAIQQGWPGHRALSAQHAADEIGELSRHYAKLLDRVREYNDYLRTLSRKLSHELRTPIAVIQTSLDNLEQARETPDDADVYVQRAREGLSRLQHILTAMSEANRLEESIRNNQTQELDLAPLIRDVFEAYRGIYTGHSLSLDMQCDCAPVQGAPDLIVQALDKLVENAASFCPADGAITLRLAGDGARWAIQLSNDGPSLPAEIQDHLFDPMVSLREEQAGNVHLGLGLHIVRLISDFHQGQVRAENRPDHSGVLVTLLLPKLENGAS